MSKTGDMFLEAQENRIKTAFVYPPIPIRTCDWVAYDDNNEELYAYGETEQEAIDNLIILMEEHNDR